MDDQQFTQLLAVLHEIKISLRVIAEHVDPEAFHQDGQETDPMPEVMLVLPRAPIRPQGESPQTDESVLEIGR